jgi:hypothetical protein
MLTAANYHSKDNTAISNSRIGDYLLSKKYYYDKHVARTLIEKKTDAMTLGSIVDMIFSGEDPETKFRAKVGRGDKDGPDDGKTAVTETLWNKAYEMGRTLVSAEFYKFYGKHTKFQFPISGYVPCGDKKIEICGMPDALTIIKKKKKVAIWDDDLKTAALGVMRTTASWYWHAHEFGYFRQFAMRRHILSQMFPGAEITQRHIVISSTKRGLHEMRLFVIPEELTRDADKIFKKTVIEMSEEKDFTDPPLGWDKAVVLAAPSERVIFANQEE